MPSTYTVNLGIEKPATGEQSGTWGDTTNVNFDILDQAINGAERVTLTSAGSSGSPNSLQITNGATSDGRNKWLEFYSSSDLGGSAFVQLDPNDAEKIVFVRNSLAGSQSVILFQGTYNAARDLEVPAGVDMVVKFDGGGASAATVTDVFTKLRATEITTPTLTATTADINGGTIDNSVIGGSTAAAVTGTTVVANTSLNIAGDGATVTGIKDEDDMSSNSPTKLATQQSIKAYVDSQVGTVDTWAEVLANGATSGSTNPEVTAGQALKTNTINETTAGSGVTIDSVLLKDDVVNATDIETGSISANDGTAAATIANSTGNFTITNFISNSVDIGGGAIDGTNIGASSRATGDFTTFSTNGATTIGGAAKFTADVDTASSGGLELKIGKIAATPSDATDAFVAIHDTGGPGALAGDLVLVPRSSNTVANAVRLYSGYTTPVERLAVARLESVINDPGNDYDFRVESNNNANMLFVDGGNNTVNVGVSSGYSGATLSVAGSIVQANGNQHVIGTYGTSGLQLIGTAGGDNVVGTMGVSEPLVFRTGSAERARILAGGNITINTVDAFLYSPASSGGTYIDAGIRFESSNKRLEFWTADAERMSIDSSGAATFNSTITVPTTAYVGTSIVHQNDADTSLDFDTNLIDVYAGGVLGVRVQPTAVTINEAGADYDFRVESSGNTHMLFVDAGANEVGIGTSDPRSPLHVQTTHTETDVTTANTNSTLSVGNAGSGNYVYNAIKFPGNQQDMYIMSFNNSTQANRRLGFFVGSVAGDAIDDERFIIKGDGDVAVINESAAPTNSVANPGDFRIQGHGWNTNLGSRDQGWSLSSTGTYSARVTGQVYPDLAFNALTTDTVYNDTTIAKFYYDGAGYKFQVDAGAVFNESSLDSDFRVESDSNSHMVFVDASTNKVGINASAPEATLDVKTDLAITEAAVANATSQLNFYSRFSDGQRGFVVLKAESLASGSSDLVINARNSFTDAEKLRIASTGDVTFTGNVTGVNDLTIADQIMHTGDTSNYMQFHQADGWRIVNSTGERFHIEGASVVFNHDGHDADFRVESSGNTHMLFVDAGNNRVGVGTNTPDSVFDVDSSEASSTALVSTFRAGSDNDNNRANVFIGQDDNSRGLLIRAGRESGDRAVTQFILNGSGGTIGSNIINAMEFYEVTGSTAFQTTFNQDGEDVDFRVESDANSNALYLDAGNDVLLVGDSSRNGAFVDKAYIGLQINRPGIDDNGGHMFMTQSATTDVWMDICAAHDDGATGVLFLIHGVRTLDQNRSYGALVRFAYDDTFNIMSVNQQNTVIEYRVSGNVLQYRFTSPGPYIVNLTIMAAG